MNFRILLLTVCVMMTGGFSLVARASESIAELGPGREFLPAAMTQAGVEQRVGESLPLGLVFRDDRGQMLRLENLFDSEHPVILSLNYSNCPMLCVLQLNGLVNALREVDLVAGRDFRVVSVSLDPKETVAQAAITKEKYLDSYGREADPNGWNFLTGSADSIEQLAEAVGIRYVYMPEKKEYSHPAVFCICTPDGKISRYHLGIEFPPQTVRLSLVEASEGKIGTVFDQFVFLCFHYDHEAGRYAPSARMIMKLGGVAVIFGLGVLWLICQRLHRRRLAEATVTGQGPARPDVAAGLSA